MAAKTAAELVVDIVTDATKATGFADVAGDAGDMERAVKSAGDTAERTGRQIGISADAADELGGKAGKATGALGALSSGFELVGAEKYAVALQSAGMATDFMSGVGDSLNLVMESTAVKTAIAKVQMVAHAIASGASAAATGVMTAAQWALNAAMSANPIALVVIALAALAAGLVLAYKHSETVRNIVQAVGRFGVAAFDAVSDAIGDVVQWVGSRLPGGFATAKDAVVLYVGIMTAGPRLLLEVVRSIVNKVGELPAAFVTAKDKAVEIGEKLLSPFRDLANAVQHILDLIGKIKVPKVDLNPFNGRVAIAGGGGSSSTTSSTTVDSRPNLNVTIQGAIDPYSTALQIRALLDDYAVTYPI